MRFLIIALLLTSCAWMRPEPKIITKEVKVIVTVPCIKKEDLPPNHVERETSKLTRGDSIHKKAQALLIDNNALDSENITLWALVTGCISPQTYDRTDQQ